MDKIFETPFRPNFEFWAALSWAFSGTVCVAIKAISNLPAMPLYVMLTVCFVMAIFRGNEAYAIHSNKSWLKGYDLEILPYPTVAAKFDPRGESLYAGMGFVWTQTCVERAMSIIMAGMEKYVNDLSGGVGVWLHGIGRGEHDLPLSIKFLNGHTLILGTTRAGKTRMFDLFIAQCIARGEPVIVIDPKGDKELCDKMRRACKAVGKPNKFVYFHPAHPERSHRINPLENWAKPTELASRIAALIPSETGADPFAAFGWMAISNIINGLVMIDEKPNLVMIRKYVEGDMEVLVLDALKAYFDKYASPNWQSDINAYRTRNKSEVDLFIEYFSKVVSVKKDSPEIAGLLMMFKHNREHFQKMIASLMPILTMLTIGEVGKLLSPKIDDGDPRPVTSAAQIIDKCQVAYIGLDSLSDSVVGSAIGSILLADLTAVAGNRYNFRDQKPVNIFSDESAETLNNPALQLLNKSGGAGFRIFLAAQTVADFEVRLGSEGGARKVLGNCNNVICLRTLDGPSQKFFSESLPTVKMRTVEQQYRSGVDSGKPAELSGSYGESLKQEDVELVPPYMLGMLPPLHFFAKLQDGTVFKGRIPIIQYEENTKEAA